jgi:hypothetical protein
LSLASGSAVFAQGLESRPRTVAAQAIRPRTVTVPEAVFIESEKAAVERDHLRVVVQLKDEQLKAKDNQLKGKDDQIAALNGLLGIERSRGDNWMKAALERKDAIVFDDKAAKLQEADNLRLRTERDSARAHQKWFGLGGLVLGVALGAFSQKGK